MTERTSFLRKIAYGVAIAVIAVGMMWLSAPATTTKDGGKLAELRKDYRLAQVNLGEVDPASETIKLATLGLRGVAVNLLWEKANHYKKVEDWTNLTATLEQLAKLQPNFITFWKFQAWNLTYNVSVEFDDYHDRYYYVRRGIEFLKKGEEYNKDNPQLLWDLGWFIGQKIGRADEHVQYRRLFKADDEFHPEDRTQEQRDNWLVGKEWYLEAIDAVENRGQSIGRKSPRDFYSSPAKSQMNYAEAIEEEGYFEKARRAWIRAAEEWREFGNRVIEHSTGVRLQLGSAERLETEIADLRARLDGLMPGVRETLAQEKLSALTTDQRALLEKDPATLTADESQRRFELEPQLEVSDREVAERIAEAQPEQGNEALLMANELERLDTQLRYTRNYKRDANYDYWQTRADFEQTSNALAAREAMFEAQDEFRAANVVEARRLYEEGFDKWRLVIDEFPAVLDDESNIGEELLDFIRSYRDVLDQLDERLGDDFPLWEVIEKFDREQYFVEELAERRRRLGIEPPPSTTSPEEPPSDPAAEESPSDAPAPESDPPTEAADDSDPGDGSTSDDASTPAEQPAPAPSE